MPLPTGTISLGDIRNVVQGGAGQISMNDTNPRKLSGVSLNSGWQWSLSSAQGKAWVVSATNAYGSPPGGSPSGRPGSGTATINFTGGVYTAQVNYNTSYQDYLYQSNTYRVNSYSYANMIDNGGGFTGTPSVVISVVTKLPSTNWQNATLYGNLS